MSVLFPPEIAIVIGIILFIALCIICVCYLIRQYKKPYNKVFFLFIMVFHIFGLMYIMAEIIMQAWNGNWV
jgi:hypothetical protein